MGVYGPKLWVTFLGFYIIPICSQRLTFSSPKILDKYVIRSALTGWGSVWEGFVAKATHRPQSSSFWGLPYRILNMNPQKELLWGLWVVRHFGTRDAEIKRSKISGSAAGILSLAA